MGQATWAFEHIDHVIGVPCYDTIDVERFSCSWVIEGSGFVCEIALRAVTTSVME